MRRALFLAFAVLTSCNAFEFSPNQVFDNDTPRNLNEVNISRLKSQAGDDTITIAFVGDSQRFYDEVEEFVDKVNTIDGVDFVLLAGDVTDFGLLDEFEWIEESFSRLDKPYIAVIGNHDVIGNGEEVFERMFGPLNYSFVYKGVKFVVHNTNGREYTDVAIPDISWLENEFSREESEAVSHIVGVSHVPPTNGDFNPDLVEPYAALLARTPDFLVSLHGHVHDHEDHYPFNDGVRYITSYAFAQNTFVLLKIVNGEIIKETVSY